MEANQNFHHNNKMYRRGEKVDIEDVAELKELKVKGIVVDKYVKPKAKAKSE